MMAELTISETRLARVLGAPRKTVRELREELLLEGGEWGLVGGEIRLSDMGARKLLKKLGAAKEHAEGLLRAAGGQGGQEEAAGASEAKEPDGDVLEVSHVTRNRHIVMCWLNEPAAHADLVRVQVRDSKNFAEGQRIRCRHVEEDLWELVGRAPRSRRDDPMRDEDEAAQET